jgi:hypothetical protein
MKTSLGLFSLVCSCVVIASAFAEDVKITGTFESVRMDVLMGMPMELTEKNKEIFEKTRQIITITEKDMNLSMSMGGGIYMTYTRHGDFLLGKTVMGKTEMFYPVYVKDSDTLFLAGQKFIRKQEAK